MQGFCPPQVVAAGKTARNLATVHPKSLSIFALNSSRLLLFAKQLHVQLNRKNPILNCVKQSK
jgi:hypothetical protein